MIRISYIVNLNFRVRWIMGWRTSSWWIPRGLRWLWRWIPSRRRVWSSSRLILAEYYHFLFLINCGKQLIIYVIKCFDRNQLVFLFWNVTKLRDHTAMLNAIYLHSNNIHEKRLFAVAHQFWRISLLTYKSCKFIKGKQKQL